MRQLLCSLALASLSILGCKSEPRTMQVEIDVDGMTCQSCVEGISYEVGRLEGVVSVEVDLEDEKATVVFTEGALEPATLESTIEKIGYEAELGEVQALAPQS